MCDWLDGPGFSGDGATRVPVAIIKASLVHLYLAWIHPFGDGNGRTARLCEFLVLVTSGVPTERGAPDLEPLQQDARPSTTDNSSTRAGAAVTSHASCPTAPPASSTGSASRCVGSTTGSIGSRGTNTSASRSPDETPTCANAERSSRRPSRSAIPSPRGTSLASRPTLAETYAASGPKTLRQRPRRARRHRVAPCRRRPLPSRHRRADDLAPVCCSAPRCRGRCRASSRSPVSRTQKIHRDVGPSRSRCAISGSAAHLSDVQTFVKSPSETAGSSQPWSRSRSYALATCRGVNMRSLRRLQVPTTCSTRSRASGSPRRLPSTSRCAAQWTVARLEVPVGFLDHRAPIRETANMRSTLAWLAPSPASGVVSHSLSQNELAPDLSVGWVGSRRVPPGRWPWPRGVQAAVVRPGGAPVMSASHCRVFSVSPGGCSGGRYSRPSGRMTVTILVLALNVICHRPSWTRW